MNWVISGNEFLCGSYKVFPVKRFFGFGHKRECREVWVAYYGKTRLTHYSGVRRAKDAKLIAEQHRSNNETG